MTPKLAKAVEFYAEDVALRGTYVVPHQARTIYVVERIQDDEGWPLTLDTRRSVDYIQSHIPTSGDYPAVWGQGTEVDYKPTHMIKPIVGPDPDSKVV